MTQLSCQVLPSSRDALEVQQAQAHAAEAARGDAQFFHAAHTGQDAVHRGFAIKRVPNAGLELAMLNLPLAAEKVEVAGFACGRGRRSSGMHRVECGAAGCRQADAHLQQGSALRVAGGIVHRRSLLCLPRTVPFKP